MTRRGDEAEDTRDDLATGRTGSLPPDRRAGQPPPPRDGTPVVEAATDGAGNERTQALPVQTASTVPVGPPDGRPARPGVGAGSVPVPSRPAVASRPAARPEQRSNGRRRARLGLKRIDPWSVFVMSFLLSLFLGIALVVGVGVLYALLDSLGVLDSVDSFARELGAVGPGESLLGLNKVLLVTAVVAAVDVVLLTVLATLGAFLYNLCASFTGGLQLTLSESD